MSNYYSVRRNGATTDNERLITNDNGVTAIFPFYLRKIGNINAWEFSAVDSEGNGKIPTKFRAILFSCAQAFLDYIKKNRGIENIELSCLKHTVNGLEESYEDFVPANYTGNPGDYIIIAGSSVRDDAAYPVPNCVHVGDTTGDRPYQCEEGETFWRAEDGAYYFAVVEFASDPGIKALCSTIYYK